MRFIFISSSSGFGGGEKYLVLLISELRKKGYVAGIKINNNLDSKLEKFALDFGAYQKADVIILNGVGALYRNIFLLPKFLKIVLVQHTSIMDSQASFIRRIIRPFLIKILLIKVSILIRVCRNSIPDNFFSNIYTIHNGINFDSTYQVKKRTGSEFQLAIIGTLNSNKNQLEALKFICRSPYNIKLKILGDGPMFQELVNYTYIHNIKDRVEFFGFVLDPMKELQNCHALLILSKNEAFPFVALEAMSVGVPVIAANVGGLPELIQDGVDGFLFHRSDFSNLDSIVKTLEANEELRFGIGQNALMKVRNSFTVDHMTNKFLMAVGHD